MATQIRVSWVQRAIAKAQKYAPGEWQAELMEVAMIPAVTRGVNSISNNKGYGRRLRIERVRTKFGPGYKVQGWNDGHSTDDYYWNSPSTAWDGVRREFYGAQDIEYMRQFAENGNMNILYNMRHFRVVK